MNDRKGALIVALLPTFALTWAAAGLGAGYVLWGPRGNPGAAKIGAAIQCLEERYVTAMPQEMLVDNALRGMAASLDRFSEYYTAREWLDFESAHLKGKFGGVGIVVEVDPATGYAQVVTPIEDSPAFAADILPGDEIREVDGQSIKGLTVQQIVHTIKGDPGASVTLTLFRKERGTFTVTLVRAIVQIKAVKARMLDGGIGYVRITDFTEMIDLFDKEVANLREQGLKAMVIDLRFNGGGLLMESVSLADRFLAEGVIVTVRGRAPGDEMSHQAEKGNELPPIPLAVIVNEGTASASEIFAGAMKDRGRGAIVGSRTFGKGSVQTPFPLPDESRFKITTARYFTPNGTSVHREEGKKEYGIEPDYRVDLSREEIEKLLLRWREDGIKKGAAKDPVAETVDLQLEAAVEVMRAQMEGREPKVEIRLVEDKDGADPRD